jgi:hypothetical protein
MSDAVDPDLEQRLVAERPVPAAGFRGALGRAVTASDPGYGPRPAHLHRIVALFVAAGGVVTGVGVLEALGAL